MSLSHFAIAFNADKASKIADPADTRNLKRERDVPAPIESVSLKKPKLPAATEKRKEKPRVDKSIFTILIAVADSFQLAAVRVLFDQEYASISMPACDTNAYVLGRIGEHDVVVAGLPAGHSGSISVASVIAGAHHSFPDIRKAVMLGVAGAAPSEKYDVRLGDVVVTLERGVVQFDMGKLGSATSFTVTSTMAPPGKWWVGGLTKLRSDEMLDGPLPLANGAEAIASSMAPCAQSLFRRPGEVPVPEGRTERKEAHVIYGVIASGNSVVSNTVARNAIAAEHDAVCFDTEAAGVAVQELDYCCIRGIVHNSDGDALKVCFFCFHVAQTDGLKQTKSKWAGHGAAMAAAYLKCLLDALPRLLTKAEESKALAERVTAAVEEKKEEDLLPFCSNYRQVSLAIVSSFDPAVFLTQVQASRGPYTIGTIPTKSGRGAHWAVVVKVPDSDNVSDATVIPYIIKSLGHDWPDVDNYLFADLAGGAPFHQNRDTDVRLADVVFSTKQGAKAIDQGILAESGEFKLTGHLPPPGRAFLSGLSFMQSNEILDGSPMDKYADEIAARLGRANYCRPSDSQDVLLGATGRLVRSGPSRIRLFYGPIASAAARCESAEVRDQIRKIHTGTLAIDNTASALVGSSENRYLVVRGISHYCDGQDTSIWKGAATASCGAAVRWLLESMPPRRC